MFTKIKGKIAYLIKVKRNKRLLKNIDYLNDIKSYEEEIFFADGKEKRLAVYTAIIGKYDNLLKQNSISKYCDYFCITDNRDIKSNIWKIIYVDKNDYGLNDIENTKVARYIKTHPHIFFKNYQHSLWIDSNIIIEREISEWIYKYLKNDDSSLVHLHPDRFTLNQEVKEVIDAKKDSIDNITKQIENYRKDGFNCDTNGLIMTNVIYRKNTREVNEFNELWWNQIKNYSKRDQLSFNYSAWKTELKYSTCDLDPFGNIFFTRLKHNYTNK